MLCTPPAFILSQDQTLEIIVSKHGFCRDLIFLLSSLALSFFYFLLSSILICKNFRDPFQAFIALYFSLVVQFSKIILGQLAFARRPSYYTTSFSACQYLFKTFSSFLKFFDPSSSNVVFPTLRDCGEPNYSTTFLICCQELFYIFWYFVDLSKTTTTKTMTFYTNNQH